MRFDLSSLMIGGLFSLILTLIWCLDIYAKVVK